MTDKTAPFPLVGRTDGSGVLHIGRPGHTVRTDDGWEYATHCPTRMPAGGFTYSLPATDPRPVCKRCAERARARAANLLAAASWGPGQ